MHPIEKLWREVGLPEYFLGNGGTNTKLYELYDRLTVERDGARAAAIDECAKLLERWRDEAKEFAASSPRCEIQMNVCRNAAVAIRNLAAHRVASPTPGGPDA